MIYYGASDIGLKRSENQDSFMIAVNKSNELLAVVCDGIGGGNAGDVASSLAANYLKEQFEKTSSFQEDSEVKHWITNVVQKANDLIFLQSVKKKSLIGMGTTCVGVLITKKDSYVFNVGDSRVYGLYDDFVCLTEDHSLINALVKSGQITAQQALTHPKRNILTNALGIMNQVRIDVNKIHSEYKKLLVCSDGLHGYVPEKLIENVLKKETAIQEQVYELIELSIEAGGYDNVTIIVLEKGDHYG